MKQNQKPVLFKDPSKGLSETHGKTQTLSQNIPRFGSTPKGRFTWDSLLPLEFLISEVFTQ